MYQSCRNGSVRLCAEIYLGISLKAGRQSSPRDLEICTPGGAELGLLITYCILL